MLNSTLLRNVIATVIYNATVAPLEMNLETAWLSLRHIHMIIIRAELFVTKLNHRLIWLFSIAIIYSIMYMLCRMLLTLIIQLWINLHRMHMAISTSALVGVRPSNCAPKLNCKRELWGDICARLVKVSISVLHVRCNMAFAKYTYHNTI